MDKNIQYILEVARCGGITRAAEKLYITPSALSKFVQAREEEMSIRLFRRLGKKFVLTDAGQYYVRKCEEIERIQNESNSSGIPQRSADQYDKKSKDRCSSCNHRQKGN